MSIYRPTWLYIKQHNRTGLRYFGKTTRDPLRYSGSGTYWKRHLKIHGNDVTTIWHQLFEDKEALVKYALDFSNQHQIVKSSEWANCIPENGLDGGAPGRILGEETKNKISKKLTGVPAPKHTTKEQRELHRAAIKASWDKSARTGVNHPMYNRKHREESKAQNAESNRNRPRFCCPHCGNMYQRGILTRWHGDNCKHKP